MRRPPERRVVLADVARLAGTSEATASRALKDDPRIGEATRAAVRAAAHKLGYVPNAAARSLRAQRTHILGLLLDDLADPVHGKVAAGFEEAAASHGYAVFMMTGLHDEVREQRALRGIRRAPRRRRGAGVMRQRPGRCLPAGPQGAGGLRPARLSGPRRRRRVPPRGVLRSDDAGGFTAAVDHLVEQGYRRIAYVGPGSGASDALRRAAASEALDRSGLGPMSLRRLRSERLA